MGDHGSVGGPRPVVDVAVAPHPTLGAALEAALALLERAGLGRWRLAEPGASDGDGITLAVPGEAGHVRLEPDPAIDPSVQRNGPQQHLMLEIARILATMVSADRHTVRIETQAAEAERESSLDPLTGVANAGAWWRILGRQADACTAQGTIAILAVVDLDQLKPINDEHGHLAGDLLLRTAASALTHAVRGHDVVARVGGDEFGVLLVDPDPPEPDLIARRLEHSLAAAGVEASAGAAKYTAGARINDTYHLADRAMYQAKAERRAHHTRSQQRSPGSGLDLGLSRSRTVDRSR
jgi:diguanylate cyclase (GGDEF)-like protein